jgi:hypothetical protein
MRGAKRLVGRGSRTTTEFREGLGISPDAEEVPERSPTCPT